MTKVYLIRHCQASGNLTNRFQGHINGTVTELGLHQLACLEQKFRSIHVNKIYSSPLDRAYMTAEAVGRGCGIDDITVDEEIIEICGGNLEGKTPEEMVQIDPVQSKNWFNAFHLFSPVGGESTAEVYDRMYKAFVRIVAENEGKTVVVVTHGCAIRCLLCALKGIPLEQSDSVGWVENTGVCVVDCDGGDYKMAVENDISHYDQYLISQRKPLWFAK